MVDCVFADVAQPDQARIVALNSHYFLKNGGHYVISIKANCIDSTAPAEAVFVKERQKLAEEGLKPSEQVRVWSAPTISRQLSYLAPAAFCVSPALTRYTQLLASSSAAHTGALRARPRRRRRQLQASEQEVIHT